MDRSTPSRRGFLALTAAGSSLSVAGCSGLLDDEPGATDGGTERQVALFVEPDQEAVQEMRSRLGQQIEDDNLSQQEVQSALARARRDLLSDTVARFESEMADRAVTVEETVEPRGALLLSGPATALIDLLSHDLARAMVDAEGFEELQTPEG